MEEGAVGHCRTGGGERGGRGGVCERYRGRSA